MRNVKNRMTNSQNEQEMTSSLIISSTSVKFPPFDQVSVTRSVSPAIKASVAKNVC